MTYVPLHVDQSSWSQIRVTGEDRVRFLHGMCTANIEALKEGDWVRASLLTAKGRVVSFFDIVHRGDHLMLVCEPQLGEKTIDALRKYAIIDDVEFELTSGPLHRVWSDPASVWSAPPIFESPPDPVASAEEVDVRRIEAGFPSYGVDISEDHFPFECLLGDYIDYAKGCYIGQEPIARVHSRGSAQKVLRGLVLEGDGAAEPGTPISHPDKSNLGAITSSAISPTFGPIALAYIHRTAWDAGTVVTAGGRSATVRELPLT